MNIYKWIFLYIPLMREEHGLVVIIEEVLFSSWTSRGLFVDEIWVFKEPKTSLVSDSKTASRGENLSNFSYSPICVDYIETVLDLCWLLT